MATLKLIVLRLFLLPTNLLYAFPVAVLARVLFGKSSQFKSGNLIVTIRSDSFLAKKFPSYMGLTLGHAILLAEKAPDETFRHELTHVQQLEAAGLVGLAGFITIAAMGFWEVGFLGWLFYPAVMYGAHTLVALLHGGDAYWDNAMEQAARDRARLN